MSANVLDVTPSATSLLPIPTIIGIADSHGPTTWAVESRPTYCDHYSREQSDYRSGPTLRKASSCIGKLAHLISLIKSFI